jgi:paraquat-inducible protein B
MKTILLAALALGMQAAPALAAGGETTGADASRPRLLAQGTPTQDQVNRALQGAGKLIERGKEAVGLGRDNPEGTSRTGIQGGVPFLVRFRGTVGGLEPGAPVEVRGMRMGAVREVRVSFDAATEDFDIPVVIELDPAPFVADEPGPAAAERVHAAVAAMVRRGLRAQVGTQNLMSGERLVRLEMVPEAGPAELQRRDGGLPEVPAAATAAEAPAAALDRLLARLAALPIEQVGSDMAQTLVTTRQLVGSPELREAVTRLATLVAKLEEQTGPLMAELDRAARRVAGLAEQGKATMADTNRLLADSRGLPDDLTVLLQELARAARSVRVLAEFLERQPNALIRGRTASAP